MAQRIVRWFTVAAVAGFLGVLVWGAVENVVGVNRHFIGACNCDGDCTYWLYE